MKRTFQWDNLSELLKAGVRLQSMQGIGKAVEESLVIDESSRHFRMEISWQDSGHAEGYVYEFGQADHPICYLNTGYMSGFASSCIGKNVYFIEQQCQGKGDPLCTAVGADADTWGSALEPYLPYFQADDIKSRIDDLTHQLENKTQELALQRRLLTESEDRDKRRPSQLRSESFRRSIEFASIVAHHDLPVLITGEAGVGKKYLTARLRSWHFRSD